MPPAPNLLPKWLDLWRRLGVTADTQPIWSELVAHYSTPPRAYHNLAHIGHCLSEFESVRALCTDPKSIEMAIWYHDAIYVSHASDNEEQSAALAVRDLQKMGLPYADAFGATVTNLILATKHRDPPGSPDAALLVDIDLSILGQPVELFDAYERQIREEYQWVSDEGFRHGRARVLKTFLDRPAIFATETFSGRYEAAARENLRRSVAALGI